MFSLSPLAAFLLLILGSFCCLVFFSFSVRFLLFNALPSSPESTVLELFDGFLFRFSGGRGESLFHEFLLFFPLYSTIYTNLSVFVPGELLERFFTDTLLKFIQP